MDPVKRRHKRENPLVCVTVTCTIDCTTDIPVQVIVRIKKHLIDGCFYIVRELNLVFKDMYF